MKVDELYNYLKSRNINECWEAKTLMNIFVAMQTQQKYKIYKSGQNNYTTDVKIQLYYLPQ